MASDGTSAGDLFKQFERTKRTYVDTSKYVMLRLDIRAGHSYLKKAPKPFDLEFIDQMGELACYLCGQIDGAKLAYSQSDEISILVYQPNTRTQAWFGGQVQKIVSISAGLASAWLTRRRPDAPIVTFDSRIAFVMDKVSWVNDYLVWRQKDAIRNSVSMAAQSHFSHASLQNLKSSELIVKLKAEADVDWELYDARARYGQLTTKQGGEKEVVYTHSGTGEIINTVAYRTWWETNAAPAFPSDFLNEDEWN